MGRVRDFFVKHRNQTVMGSALAVFVFGTFHLGFGPALDRSGPRVVEIPANSRSRDIARLLEKAGVVRSGPVFHYYLIATGRARRLQSGEYEFSGRASLEAVAKKLSRGLVKLHKVVIPEGFTARQIGEALEAKKVCPAEVFVETAENTRVARDLNVPGKSLEGFLFPDTYFFSRGLSAEQLARRMVERFRQKVDRAAIEKAKPAELSFYQVVILASMVELEARQPAEQGLIASVFLNRLRRRMRLESDPTVLYSQKRLPGAVSYQDLETRSEYNTYRHRGLPPGPIGNPGLSAIQAASHPAGSEYLFFVADGRGGHIFSKDFESHKLARWRLKKSRREAL